MTGREKIFSLLEPLLKKSGADQAEAVYVGSNSGLTRYANSIIHQNVAESNSRVYFRVALGKKIGVASTNTFEKGELSRALNAALEIARHQRETLHFNGLPGKQKYPKLTSYYKATAAFGPKERAAVLKKIFEKAAKHNLQAYGSLKTGEGELAVLNSNGVRAYQPQTIASINLITMSDDSSGYAEGLAQNTRKLDFDLLAETSIEKCLAAHHPQEIPPGKYEVVLEPVAVGNLFEWLSFVSFGSVAFQEKSSCLAGRIGQQLFGPNVTIYDDATDAEALPFPFDFEGTAKRKVTMVDKGVAKGVVYDTLTGAKEGKKSTGHALTPDASAQGAVPLHIGMKAGPVGLSKMVKNVARGFLVTRFHYLNGFLDPPQATMTGMTRDGVFLVEEGQIKHGVKNLRFTESMVKAFSNVVELSRERKLVNTWWDALGGIHVPALRIREFTFSGKTDF
ncbi:MAG: TldD/PmbA family protein [candidate division Zixibacteria bacterium]|nr:TldD/PmbA family protein [candidate division Zixibacteria bacterium]